MWQLLVIFYFIFGVTNYILRRVLAQKLGEHIRVLNAIFFIVFLLPATIIMSFFFPPDFNISLLNLFLLIAGSIIWPVLGLTSFYANKDVDVGIFTIISNLSPLFTLAVALPFLHDSINGSQAIGIGLLVLSGIIATSSQLKKHSRTSLNGLLFSLLSAVLMGFAIGYESFMLRRVGLGTYLLFGWGAQIVWAAILAGKELKKLPDLFRQKGTGKTLTIWGGTKVLGSVTFISALNISGNAAIISAATNFLSVAIVIAAYFYLKERQHIFQKVLGVGIGVAGLLLIARPQP